jgi:Spy/CpxP family protein refolding chaperone
MMKKEKKFVVLILVLMIAMSSMAQGKHERALKGDKAHPFAYLDLSEEQMTQLKAFRLEMQSTTKELKLDLEEMRVQLKRLMTADEVDEEAVMLLADKMGAIQTQIKKAHLKNNIQQRSVLSEEQKVLFDSKNMERRKKQASRMERHKRSFE